MITIFGEGRGFRVIWLLEEMGLPYRLRDVDLLQDISEDTEFLAVNPAGFIPVLVDRDTVMVESIAILQYLMARYGPTPLAVDPGDPGFGAYLQFLHLGEAGLSGPINVDSVTRFLAPEGEKANWTTRWAKDQFASRLGIVTRQLTRTPYLAGDRFTAADISVTYALEQAWRTGCYTPGEMERDYIARTTARDSYARAMDTCHMTKGWVAGLDLK